MLRLFVLCLAFGYGLGGGINPLQLEGNNTELGASPYIVLGEVAANGAYPYQISLQRGGAQRSHFCGGSILTKNWVMSAGHCCAIGTFDVLVGTNSLSQGTQLHKVSSYKIHPNYDPNRNWRNDICLIKLATPLTFSNVVQPVKLPQQGKELAEGDVLDVTGWGYTSPNNKVIPDKLQLGRNYKYISREKCGTLSRVQMFEGYLCVLGPKQGAGICQGDSGGPIVKNGVQYGICSFIFLPCGGPMPDFFARVPNYITWIQQTLGPEASELRFG